MIQHIKNTELDKGKWDDCIRKSPNGSLFAYSWYLDIVSPGWEALIENDYEKVFPLTWRKKYGIAYLFQPFFTYYWDVYAAGEISEKDRMGFMAAIPAQYKFIDYAIATAPVDLPADFQVSERKAQSINLARQYSIIRKDYSENLSRNLKKAERSGYSLSENISPSLLVTLFRKENHKKLKEFGKKEYVLMENILNACVEKKLCILAGVKGKNDSCISCAAFLPDHNRIIYFKGASTEEGRKNGAMHFMMDALIKRYAGKEFVYDFGGSNVPGVARFNHHFGAGDSTYYHIRKNALPAPLKWIKK